MTAPAEAVVEVASDVRIYHAHSCHNSKIAVCGYRFTTPGAYHVADNVKCAVCLSLGTERYCDPGSTCLCACCVPVVSA